jgi:hypothetical protein
VLTNKKYKIQLFWKVYVQYHNEFKLSIEKDMRQKTKRDNKMSCERCDGIRSPQVGFGYLMFLSNINCLILINIYHSFWPTWLLSHPQSAVHILHFQENGDIQATLKVQKIVNELINISLIYIQSSKSTWWLFKIFVLENVLSNINNNL